MSSRQPVSGPSTLAKPRSSAPIAHRNFLEVQQTFKTSTGRNVIPTKGVIFREEEKQVRAMKNLKEDSKFAQEASQRASDDRANALDAEVMSKRLAISKRRALPPVLESESEPESEGSDANKDAERAGEEDQGNEEEEDFEEDQDGEGWDDPSLRNIYEEDGDGGNRIEGRDNELPGTRRVSIEENPAEPSTQTQRVRLAAPYRSGDKSVARGDSARNAAPPRRGLLGSSNRSQLLPPDLGAISKSSTRDTAFSSKIINETAHSKRKRDTEMAKLRNGKDHGRSDDRGHKDIGRTNEDRASSSKKRRSSELDASEADEDDVSDEPRPKSKNKAGKKAKVVRQKPKLGDYRLDMNEMVYKQAIDCFKARLLVEGPFPTAMEEEDMKKRSFQWAVEQSECSEEEAPIYTPQVAKMLGPFAPSLRGHIRSFVRGLIVSAYGFSQDSADDKVEANRVKYHDLKKKNAFIFANYSTRQGLYAHRIIQQIINEHIFQGLNSLGIRFHKDFNPFPLPTLAFIMTCIEACLDDWQRGTFIKVKFEADLYRGVWDAHMSQLREFGDRAMEIAADAKKLPYLNNRDDVILGICQRIFDDGYRASGSAAVDDKHSFQASDEDVLAAIADSTNWRRRPDWNGIPAEEHGEEAAAKQSHNRGKAAEDHFTEEVIKPQESRKANTEVVPSISGKEDGPAPVDHRHGPAATFEYPMVSTLSDGDNDSDHIDQLAGDDDVVEFVDEALPSPSATVSTRKPRPKPRVKKFVPNMDDEVEMVNDAQPELPLETPKPLAKLRKTRKNTKGSKAVAGQVDPEESGVKAKAPRRITRGSRGKKVVAESDEQGELVNEVSLATPPYTQEEL